MELLYHPVLCESASYQFLTEKEPASKTLRNITSSSQAWGRNVFNIIRDELVTGNITLIISKIDTTEPVVITRKALPANDLYIFDFTLTEKEYRQTFDKEAVYHKKGLDYWGFSTATLQMTQTNAPGHLFYKVEILVSRSYLIHFIKQLSLNEQSVWHGHIENNDDFYNISNLGLDEVKLLDSLVRKYQQERQQKMARILSTNLIHEILAKLLSRLFLKHDKDGEKVKRSDFNRIMEVKKMMESRLDIKYSLEEACRNCNMSPTKFKYLFKSVAGSSFADYYIKIRMEEAVRQLEKQSTESISQLSLQLGYKDPSQFTRAFKDYFKYTPTDFLKVQKFPDLRQDYLAAPVSI